MDKDLKKGTRIYYGGDMANEEGVGVITRRITDQFGTYVDIRMDDKRFLPLISVTAFSDKYLGHGGTRFVMLEAYTDFRQDQINKVEAALAKNDAERSTKTTAEERRDLRSKEQEDHKKRKPISTSTDELRCKTCWNWNPEDLFDHTYSDTSGHVLICSNCGAWNTGIIESRPIERIKKVDVEGIIKGRN
ncbi:MAG: hypothetical protein KAV87_24775 [Desulfobacteraceae bacterium]|nr:hypothetical protein [Desulfobacteraceae bacterium]